MWGSEPAGGLARHTDALQTSRRDPRGPGHTQPWVSTNRLSRPGCEEGGAEGVPALQGEGRVASRSPTKGLTRTKPQVPGCHQPSPATSQMAEQWACVWEAAPAGALSCLAHPTWHLRARGWCRAAGTGHLRPPALCTFLVALPRDPGVPVSWNHRRGNGAGEPTREAALSTPIYGEGKRAQSI